ncbi:MAG: hypothetical protein ABEK17_01410 [Candidatus Aenigmatarchaeota archaeon]
MKRKKIVFPVFLVTILIIVGGCTQIEQDENEDTSTINSIDATINIYRTEGGLRIKAREYGAAGEEWRLDEIKGNNTYIYNNQEMALYLNDSERDGWQKITGSYVNNIGYQNYGKFVDIAWTAAANNGLGTYNATYNQQIEVKITINKINPTFSDEIFKPPKGVEIEEITVNAQ